jgi:TfoX/Sxy family transcriptional regulator of competence genes
VAYDEKLAQRIRTILSTRRDVVERKMFGGIAFMIRGHMSCGIVGPTLMVRVDPDDEGRLLRLPHARPMDFTGRPMRGFLYVDPPGLAAASGLRAWVRRAAAWAESQPAKSAGKPPAARSGRAGKTRSGIKRPG